MLILETGLVVTETTHCLEGEHLVNFVDLIAEVEVLRDWFDALTHHRCLNYILSAHRVARQTIRTLHVIDEVSWDLRTRSEDFPDLEGAL